MKTEQVTSKQGNIWYRYVDKDLYKDIHKRNYSDEFKRFKKCRQLFLKNVINLKNRPQARSLQKYLLSPDELDYIRLNRGDDFANSIKTLQDKLSGL